MSDQPLEGHHPGNHEPTEDDIRLAAWLTNGPHHPPVQTEETDHDEPITGPDPFCPCGCCSSGAGCSCLAYAKHERCDCDYCMAMMGDNVPPPSSTQIRCVQCGRVRPCHVCARQRSAALGPGEADDVPPPFLYHCSPTKNRASIRAEGLRPGNPSNTVEWTPPHVCYAETPARARSLTHAEGPIDLWIVATAGLGFTLANEGVEWRSQQAVPAALVDDGSEVARLTDLWRKTEAARATLEARLAVVEALRELTDLASFVEVETRHQPEDKPPVQHGGGKP